MLCKQLFCLLILQILFTNLYFLKICLVLMNHSSTFSLLKMQFLLPNYPPVNFIREKDFASIAVSSNLAYDSFCHDNIGDLALCENGN